MPLATPPRNHLLASLPPEVQAQLRPHLTQVDLPLRHILYREGEEMTAAYFPVAGMVSMVASLDDGGQAEVGVVGREGMLGHPLAAGPATAYVECMAQVAGRAWRMPAAAFRESFEEIAEFRRIMLRYIEAVQAQVMQSAACNGRHDTEARLGRWLLMCHDRVGEDVLPLSQEFIAMMLGVHRPSVTLAAGALQRAGYITHRHGRVRMIDRPGLEEAACECYRTVRRRYVSLLGSPDP